PGIGLTVIAFGVGHGGPDQVIHELELAADRHAELGKLRRVGRVGFCCELGHPFLISPPERLGRTPSSAGRPGRVVVAFPSVPGFPSFQSAPGPVAGRLVDYSSGCKSASGKPVLAGPRPSGMAWRSARFLSPIASGKTRETGRPHARSIMPSRETS